MCAFGQEDVICFHGDYKTHSVTLPPSSDLLNAQHPPVTVRLNAASIAAYQTRQSQRCLEPFGLTQDYLLDDGVNETGGSHTAERGESEACEEANRVRM